MRLFLTRLLPRFLVFCSSFNLVACEGFFPGVFQIDIAQGNILSQKMLDDLDLGLGKQQVLYVLGTPLVEDRFSAEQWDYLYYFSKEGQAPRIYRATLVFESGRLARIETSGDEIRAWHERAEPDLKRER